MPAISHNNHGHIENDFRYFSFVLRVSLDLSDLFAGMVQNQSHLLAVYTYHSRPRILGVHYNKLGV
jgi:hypothetical protein